ncbi:MAG: lysozyme, partial [Lachnospiraceae bacterium]|nr:lysozyme [Lachnospiraceae bacterium]
MRKKSLRVLFVIVLSVTMFTGCTSTNGEKNETKSTTAEKKEATTESASAIETKHEDIGDDANISDLYSYLDYAEEKDDSMELIIVLGCNTYTFQKNLSAKQIVFGEGLKEASNIQVKMSDDSNQEAKITLDIPKNNLEINNLSIDATVTLKAESLLDGDGKKVTKDCTIVPNYVYKDTSKATQEQKSEEKTNWEVSDNGVKLIAKYEGCRLDAYRAPSGIWTIGYGHIEGVKKGDTLSSNDEALDLLKKDLRRYEAQVNKLIKQGIISFPLNQNQFD